MGAYGIVGKGSFPPPELDPRRVKGDEAKREHTFFSRCIRLILLIVAAVSACGVLVFLFGIPAVAPPEYSPLPNLAAAAGCAAVGVGAYIGARVMR